MSGVEPVVGQVVTVFRSRVRPEAREAYLEDVAQVVLLARARPGFVESKVFTADDGERVNVVTFADEASHRGWREDPEHRAAQRRGTADYYEAYSIQVGTTSYASAFARA